MTFWQWGVGIVEFLVTFIPTWQYFDPNKHHNSPTLTTYTLSNGARVMLNTGDTFIYRPGGDNPGPVPRSPKTGNPRAITYAERRARPRRRATTCGGAR